MVLAAVTAIGVVVIKPDAVAHHAFSAEFDANLPVRLGGPITRVEWINPHTWIHLDNNDPEATRDPGPWMVEGGTPNTLLRRGINRNSLTLGDDIVVTGYQSKDRLCEPTCRANGRDITFPDAGNCSWVHPVLVHRVMVRTLLSPVIGSIRGSKSRYAPLASFQTVPLTVCLRGFKSPKRRSKKCMVKTQRPLQSERNDEYEKD